MDRRTLLGALAAGLLAAPLAVEAQKAARVPRIGCLWPGDAARGSLGLAAFRQGLRDNGYVDGETVVTQLRSAGGDIERLSELAAELVLLNPEVIFAVTAAGAVAGEFGPSRRNSDRAYQHPSRADSETLFVAEGGDPGHADSRRPETACDF